MKFQKAFTTTELVIVIAAIVFSAHVCWLGWRSYQTRVRLQSERQTQDAGPIRELR